MPTDPAAAKRDRLGLEVLAVLGVSLGISALSSILSYSYDLARTHGHISSATATVIAGANTSHPVFDLLYDLLGLLNGVVPPLLALLLLSRNPGGTGFGDRLRPARAPRRAARRGVRPADRDARPRARVHGARARASMHR